jgi:hypothetical protein
MMRLLVVFLGCLGCSAAKPPASDQYGVARWILNQTTWGVITTTSIHLDGAPFGNPISTVELGGVPYFYTSGMDTSMQDLEKNPECTLSLSEAAIDCSKLKLDPEDPRCARLSLSGKMVNVTDETERANAKAQLFAVHPVMKSWPGDHGWLIMKLEIESIWLIAKFGGAANLNSTEYFAAPAPAGGMPVSPAHDPQHHQPLFTDKAGTARWLIRESSWATLATTSVHLNGTAFGNPISIADGPDDNATGIPYMLISNLDTSAEDLAKDANCTLTFSQAEINCALHGITGSWDPEDPRCTRLSVSGKMVKVTDPKEQEFASKALVSKHPSVEGWLDLGGFYVVKLEIKNIWLIDFFGGASDIAVDDYFKAAKTVAHDSITMI